ncbi:MAG: hypothetical protein ABI887_00900 [Burkholderiales bacterium]
MVAIASYRCIVMALVAGLTGASAGVARADDEISETTRLTRIDVPNVAARSLPGYRTDLAELSYQRWASNGRADVGVGVGSVMLVDRPTGMLPGRSADGVALSGSGTMLMLGLRYRTTEHSSVYADAAHVRGLGLDGEDRVVSKVGVEFKAAQSDWKIAYGGLGFRLAGDARMTVKLRRSGVAVYMRRAF